MENWSVPRAYRAYLGTCRYVDPVMRMTLNGSSESCGTRISGPSQENAICFKTCGRSIHSSYHVPDTFTVVI